MTWNVVLDKENHWDVILTYKLVATTLLSKSKNISLEYLTIFFVQEVFCVTNNLPEFKSIKLIVRTLFVLAKYQLAGVRGH